MGKKYTALTIDKEMRERELKADFRASGQTGIFIAGKGIAVDCVVSDFIAGAAELLSSDNDADHWDLIEGQGSLYNPSYAGVSLGLPHVVANPMPSCFVTMRRDKALSAATLTPFPIFRNVLI